MGLRVAGVDRRAADDMTASFQCGSRRHSLVGPADKQTHATDWNGEVVEERGLEFHLNKRYLRQRLVVAEVLA